MLLRLATGSASWMEAPEGIMTVSVLDDSGLGAGVWGRAIDGGREHGADAVGTTCWDAIASCNKHLTSSAEAKSTGAWPSWFLRNGSAPWAS